MLMLGFIYANFKFFNWMLHGDSKKHGDDHVYLWLIITHEILYIFMLGLGTSPIISTLLSLENWKASPAIAILTF